MPSSSKNNKSATAEAYLKDFFRDGICLEAPGNRPVLLEEQGTFWMITAGEADLFAVRIQEGKPTGSRTHLFRAVTGSILFRIHMETSGQGMGVIAVGKPGTELTRFDITEFERGLTDPRFFEAAVRSVEIWIEKISVAITQESPPPGKYQDVAIGQSAPYEESAVLRSSRETAWIRQVSGNVTLLGDTELPPLNREQLFPIAKNVWLRSQGVSKIRAFSTSDILGTGELWPSLESFHQIVLQCVHIRLNEEEETARRRLKDQASKDNSRLQDALFSLGATLFSKRKRPLAGVSAGNPLCAAVGLVAKAAGINVDRSAVSGSSETEAVSLDDLAREGHFHTRQVILKEGWWRGDNGPLLAYTRDDRRPVALLPTSARRYDMVDPRRVVRARVTSDMVDTFEPQAYAFYRPLPSKALSFGDLVKFAFHGIIKDISLVVVVGALGAIVALLIPIMTGIIIDSVIPNSAKGELFQIGMILLVCVLATLMFDITRSIAMVRIEGRMDASVQAGVIDRLLALPVPFFRKFTAGDLANRTMGINAIREILSGATLTAIMSGIFSLFSLILLFYYDLKLALVAIGLTLLGVLFTVVLSIWMVRYQRQIFDIQGKTSGIVLQLLTGIAKLRVTGTEDRAFAVWANRFAEKKAIAFKSGKINAGIDTISSFIPLLATTVIFVCFLKFRMGDMSTGQFLAFNAAFGGFQNALLQTTLVLSSSLQVIPLFERARPILEAIPETDERKGKIKKLNGDIEAAHLMFRYSPDGPLILKDVSLRISPGEFVGMVGESGSGKSTLLRLFLGFERPESGAIYYDGQDMKDIDIREIRRKLGVVLQNGQVMSGSIFTNIIGTANLTLDDAWEAARMVGLADDIKEMPMGMHTMVPPGGTTLSGGQRQRLMIASAIVRRPRIIFFDEATSALDNLTQRTVSESLERLQVTRVVIAHRLSTIINADKIYVLQDGEIIETGIYSELMANKGYFYELAKRQIA
jgi:NHLM bacteriocin system ABC transporter ATP-binding protein